MTLKVKSQCRLDFEGLAIMEEQNDLVLCDLEKSKLFIL